VFDRRNLAKMQPTWCIREALSKKKGSNEKRGRCMRKVEKVRMKVDIGVLVLHLGSVLFEARLRV